MANTYVDYTAVASQTDYNFSFEYLRDDHVKVKVNGTLVTNYTIVTSPVQLIRFNTAPTDGAAIKIYRDSRGDFSPLVDFVNGSVLTESELDESYKHNLFVSQEASEGQGGEQLTKKGLTNYDAEGNKIINLGTPTASTDAANKEYTDQAIDTAIALGGSPAIVSLGAYDVTAFGTSITKSLANWTNDLNSPTATGSTQARSLADRFADVVNVLDYIPPALHADIKAGTSTTNVASYIQEAVDTGLEVYFPEGEYIITSTISAPTLHLRGDSSHQASVIKYTGTDDIPLFKTTTDYVDKFISFSNLTFTGTDINYNTGIELTNTTREDIDAYVYHCKFNYLNKGILCKGRGLEVSECIFFANVSSIYLDRNDPVIEGSSLDQKIQTGFRVFNFVNNRFHGLGNTLNTCIRVDTSQTDNKYLRGVLFSNNYIDSPGAIIKTNGLYDSDFSNNIHIYGDDSGSLFTGTEYWERVSITNNVFGSLEAPSNVKYYRSIVELSGNAGRVSFTGNTIYRTTREVFKASNYVNTCNISNNIMYSVCKDLDTLPFAVITLGNTGLTAERNIITGNTVVLDDESNSTVQSNFSYFVNFASGTTGTNNIIKDNVIPTFGQVSNQDVDLPGAVLKKYAKKLDTDVTRNDTNASAQLLISQDLQKQTPTSKLLVEGFIEITNALGSATNIPAIELYVNGSYHSPLHYAIPSETILTFSFGHIVTDASVTNVSLYVSDQSGTAQDFTIHSNTVMTVTELID